MHVLQKDLLPSFITSGAVGGAVSGTSVYTSQFQPIESFTSYMIQLAWTGSPDATVTLEFSADPVPPLGYSVPQSLPQPLIYDVVPNTTQSTVGINVISYDVVHTCANWVRVKWTNISGSGVVISMRAAVKGSQI